MLHATGENPSTDAFHIGSIGVSNTSLSLDDIRIWSVARTESEVAINRSAYLDPATSGLERLYRFDDSTSEVLDQTGNSAPAPLAAGVTIVPGDAPVALDPAAPVAPGPNAAVRVFLYDVSMEEPLAHNDILLEFDGSGTSGLMRRWIHSQEVDEPIAFEDYASNTAPGTGSTYEVYAERLKSISRVVEVGTGSIAADYEYSAFGVRTALSASVVQSYGFTGREHDEESELTYYRGRHFDPVAGRFLQSDPLGFEAGDLNIYTFAANDPKNWTDPTGLIRVGPNTAGALLQGAGAQARASLSYKAIAGVSNLAGRIASALTRVGKLGKPKKGRTHGNDKRSDRVQEIYYVLDNNFRIQKIGLSSNASTRYGKSCLRKLGLQVMVVQRIQGGRFGNRARGLAAEKAHLLLY